MKDGLSLRPPPPIVEAVPLGVPLRVLLVEDRPSDVDLLVHLLQQAGFAPEWQSVETEGEYLAQLRPGLIASHELRTPVTTIMCTAQLLLSHLDDGDFEPTQLLGRRQAVEKMGKRLTRLIADLLDVTRLRTGRLELRTESLDLGHLVAEVVRQERVDARSGCVLAFRVVGKLPPVVADADRIEQVISNVLNNAFKYSPQDGQIDVVVRADGSGVLLSIDDHGIGVPFAALEAIFEPFARATNAQRRQLPGMGLGLYISRQIVEQHGGRIWAESPGEENGTSVRIWLPGRHPQRRSSEPSRRLIVDDDFMSFAKCPALRSGWTCIVFGVLPVCARSVAV